MTSTRSSIGIFYLVISVIGKFNPVGVLSAELVCFLFVCLCRPSRRLSRMAGHFGAFLRVRTRRQIRRETQLFEWTARCWIARIICLIPFSRKEEKWQNDDCYGRHDLGRDWTLIGEGGQLVLQIFFRKKNWKNLFVFFRSFPDDAKSRPKNHLSVFGNVVMRFRFLYLGQLFHGRDTYRFIIQSVIKSGGGGDCELLRWPALTSWYCCCCCCCCSASSPGEARALCTKRVEKQFYDPRFFAFFFFLSLCALFYWDNSRTPRLAPISCFGGC